MTGIERLREFVAGISPVTVVCGVTKTSYDREHMEEAGARLRDFLSGIADQIVREHAEDCFRMGERAAEDAKAAAWVRENGGLDSVKKLLDWVVGHCLTKQRLDFDFWLSGRVMYELGFEEDMADRDEVERRLLARLMPEGVEWPRYESGEPVPIGGAIADELGYEHVVTSVELHDDGADLRWNPAEPEECVWVGRGERVRRHAKPERPDSWERLEEDASLDPFDYCVGRGVADMGASHLEDARVMARDLVRRARALAGGA